MAKGYSRGVQNEQHADSVRNSGQNKAEDERRIMIHIPFLEVIVACPEVGVVHHYVSLAPLPPEVDSLAHVLLVV